MQQDLQASSPEEEVLSDHYKILKTLGTGNFAQVKLALHLHTQAQVALKTLEKDKKNAAMIENELEIMKFLDHPNIIKLFHVMETAGHIHMVLEYASGGDLAGRILEVDYMREREAQHIFAQMVCAVHYCHENSIAHRDIKPENILMDANRNIKLCDFGLAIKVTMEQKSTVFCGTLPYCAPELFSSQGYDPRALDIWSMGVVLYIMVTKHYPFKATTYEKMKEEMQEPHYYIPPKVPALITSLIVQLFTIDPRQRPKICDIMEHQWLKSSEELSKLTLSLETDPNTPNPSIMAAMSGMGYNPKDIRDSLHEKKFNSIMATYLVLKHQSPWVDNSNHNAKFMQPNIATTPADSSTFHLVLKKIGSKPDHHSSTLTAKCQSHNDDKLVRKKDSKHHSMPTALCCQEKSLPHPTGAQCGPVQHEHEQLLGNSLQKKSMASEGLPYGPIQHDDQLLGSSPQKRSLASQSVSCGPGQHDKQLLSSNPQKRSLASKSVSCGPRQHDEQLLGRILQKRRTASKSVSCGPGQHVYDAQLLSSSPQKRSLASKSVSCGPGQHDEQLLGNSLQKKSMASEGLPYGPIQHDDQLLGSSPQKRSLASQNVFCGPGQHDEQPLRSSPWKRSLASKSVFSGPGQHDEQPLRSSLWKRSLASKSVFSGPGQHDEQPLGTSPWKRSLASKSVSNSVFSGPWQHNDQLLGSSLWKRRMAFKSVSCGPGQHDEQPLSSSLWKRRMASKSVSCGPGQHDEQPLGIVSEHHILQAEPQCENPHNSSSSLQDAPSTRSSTTDTHHNDRSFSPQETSEPNLTSAQPQRVTSASPHNLEGGWKRVKRRMVTCLRRLCCCLPAQRRSCTSQRVAPQE